MRQNLKAQSILEYVVLAGIVSAALLAMSLYFRRSVQAMIKLASDEVGRQEEAEEIIPTESTKKSQQSNITTTTTDNKKVTVDQKDVTNKAIDMHSESSGYTEYTTTVKK